MAPPSKLNLRLAPLGTRRMGDELTRAPVAGVFSCRMTGPSLGKPPTYHEAAESPFCMNF